MLVADMKRRAFIRRIGAGMAVAAIAPDLLLEKMALPRTEVCAALTPFNISTATYRRWSLGVGSEVAVIRDGDFLNALGKITAIDHEAGVITISSGLLEVVQPGSGDVLGAIG